MKMKFSFLIILPLLLFCHQSKSQNEKSYSWSVLGGLNSSWIIFQNAYGNAEIEYSTTFGYTGGVAVNYYLNDDWGIGGNLLVTKMGQNYSGVQSDGNAERKIKLTSLELPIVMMRRVPFKANNTWITFGPDFIILLKARQEYTRVGGNDLQNPEGMAEGDVRDRFNAVDIGLNFSINQMFPLRSYEFTDLLISFNTVLGLTDINNKDWRIPQRDGSYTGSHNFYIGIKIGLSFNISEL